MKKREGNIKFIFSHFLFDYEQYCAAKRVGIMINIEMEEIGIVHLTFNFDTTLLVKVDGLYTLGFSHYCMTPVLTLFLR